MTFRRLDRGWRWPTMSGRHGPGRVVVGAAWRCEPSWPRPVPIVDARSPAKYARGHIPAPTNLPLFQRR